MSLVGGRPRSRWALLRGLAREDIGLAAAPPIVVKDELSSGERVEVREPPKISETFFALTTPRRFPNARPRMAPDPATGPLAPSTPTIGISIAAAIN